LKFYIAVGEFYSISEAINVVLVMGFLREKLLVQLKLLSLCLPSGLKREFQASSSIKTMLNYIYIDVGGKPYCLI
jgi:hypothetical protein